MNGREIAVIAAPVAATIIFGVWPAPILDLISASVEALLTNYHDALTGVGN